MLVIMTSMANELTERGESLSLEAGISSEKENSEPSIFFLLQLLELLGLIPKFETKQAEITFL